MVIILGEGLRDGGRHQVIARDIVISVDGIRLLVGDLILSWLRWNSHAWQLGMHHKESEGGAELRLEPASLNVKSLLAHTVDRRHVGQRSAAAKAESHHQGGAGRAVRRDAVKYPVEQFAGLPRCELLPFGRAQLCHPLHLGGMDPPVEQCAYEDRGGLGWVGYFFYDGSDG